MYVVLSRLPLPTASPADASEPLSGFLLTTGSPIKTTYRHAERFQVIQSGGTAVLNWTERFPSGQANPIGYRGTPTSEANYFVPTASVALQTDRTALLSRTGYDLSVQTEGTLVTGHTVIPDQPAPNTLTIGGHLVVTWRPVEGAAGYFAESDTEQFPGVLTRDTAYTLNYDRGVDTGPRAPEFRLIAMDANLYLYLSDTLTTSAGVVGAFGVFGSASSARILLPAAPPVNARPVVR